MSVLVFLVIGVIAGWLASNLMKGGSAGLVGDLVLGVIGSFVGGYLVFPLIGLKATGFIGSTVVATVGAIVFIAVIRAIKKA